MEQTQQNPIPQELLDRAALWYRGGYTAKVGNGYIREYNPYHRHGDRRGLVAQHRLVYERHIGRILSRTEVVHHIDGHKANNDISNLQLFANQAEHRRHHAMTDGNVARYDPVVVEAVRQAAADPKRSLKSLDLSPKTVLKICEMYNIEWRHWLEFGEDEVREALRGRTTAEAAAFLGCHPQTLYNRFDHLLEKRNSPGFLGSNIEAVYKKAIESGISETARFYGTNRVTVTKALKTAKLWDAYQDESEWSAKSRMRRKHAS